MFQRISLFLTAALLLLAPFANAQDTRRDVKKFNVDKKAVALQGYDPVAYFPDGGSKPTKGKKNLTVEHEGITYRFANEANRKAFQKSPEKFEPAYGGWCAYAMSQGQKVEIDPKSYLIQDGKLMVFYKGLFNDTRKKWQKKPADLQVKADKNWKKELAKKKK